MIVFPFPNQALIYAEPSQFWVPTGDKGRMGRTGHVVGADVRPVGMEKL